MPTSNGPLDQLLPALLKAQSAIKPAAKASTNPHFKSKYASLPDIWEVVSGPLHAAGLLVIQGVGLQDDTGLTVETSVCHAASGQLLTTGIRVPVIAENAQAIGSAISYGRRYGLMTLLAVVSDETDDDGNAATASAPPARAASAASAADKIMPFGKHKGVKLGAIAPVALEATIKWCTETDAEKFKDLIAACREVLPRALATQSEFSEVPPALEEGENEPW